MHQVRRGGVPPGVRLQLLEKAKQLPEDNKAANRAIGYAGMVIRYVSDGSGTMDMIERATNQLKEVLK